MQIGSGYRCGDTIETDLVSTQAIDGLDAGQRFKCAGKLGRNRGMAVDGMAAGGTNVEIRGNFAFHPLNNGGAKTADHDADGSHHGNRSGERADKNGRAAQRTKQAS